MTCLACGHGPRVLGTPLCRACYVCWRAGETAFDGGSAASVVLPRRAVAAIQVQGRPERRLSLQAERPLHLAQVLDHLVGRAHEAAGYAETRWGVKWEA